MRGARARLFAALAIGYAAAPAAAQAWMSPVGAGWAGLAWQYQEARYHLGAKGERTDRGVMYGQGLTLGAGYTPTPRLGLSASLSASFARWDANGKTQPAHGPLDDGRWHGTLQDFRLEARWQLLEEPFLVTPLVGIRLPTHDYESAGHAALGKDLVEVPVGLYAGRVLDPLLPDAWLEARYAYSFVEKLPDLETGESIGTDRSNLDVDLGYFLTPDLRAMALGSFQWGHGGLDVTEIPPPGEHGFEDHDRRVRASFTKLGVALSWAVGDFDLSAASSWTVAGKNYSTPWTATLSLSWSFGYDSIDMIFGRTTRPARR